MQLDGVGGGPEIRPHVGALGVAEGAAAVEPRPGQRPQGLVVPELRHPDLVTGQQLLPEQVLDVADLLQLHDPVVALLQRGDPLRENCWGVGGDDPPGVVGALHVLALLDLGAAFGEGVDRVDRVGGDGCAGFLGLGHLGAGGLQAAFEEVPGADLAVVDAADVGFHTGDVGEDFQPFPARQFQILRGETIPGRRGQDRHELHGPGGQVGHPDELWADGGVDIAVAQPGQHRPGHLRGLRDRQRGPADLPRIRPGDQPGRRRRPAQGGPGDRGQPLVDPRPRRGQPFGGAAALLAGGGAAGQPGEEPCR